MRLMAFFASFLRELPLHTVFYAVNYTPFFYTIFVSISVIINSVNTLINNLQSALELT